MNLTEVSIKNPVLAWMLMAGTVLFGALAVTRIGVSQYPDVDYPNVSVSASWPGAGPSAVERELVEPIEQALAQVEGVQQISSQARQGSARITVAFDMSRNIDLALQDVQAKVAQAQRQLPRDVPAATVSKSNPDDAPIITVGVTGPFARQVLADVARYQVQERLQTVPGVGQITLNGYLDRNVRLWVDESRMNERGVAITDVLNAVKREHVELPGGQLEAGGRQLSVRLLGEALDL
ncbi:MAG TPA: efflux RND transporter permease subunit, partial [Polyangiaceae bacterium]|nr:efflux RND transporter permease subunit [Polyangiaceae bacterium]